MNRVVLFVLAACLVACDDSGLTADDGGPADEAPNDASTQSRDGGGRAPGSRRDAGER